MSRTVNQRPRRNAGSYSSIPTSYSAIIATVITLMIQPLLGSDCDTYNPVECEDRLSWKVDRDGFIILTSFSKDPSNGRLVKTGETSTSPKPGEETIADTIRRLCPNVTIPSPPVQAQHDGPHEPVDSAFGDFNGDGWTDVAVADRATNQVSVFLSKGRRDQFTEPADFDAGIQPEKVEVGQLNNDNHPDLVVVNEGAFPDGASSLSILLGKAGGSFEDQTSITAPPGLTINDVALGDFDGDLNEDMAYVIVNEGVFVRLGKGDGTFGDAQAIDDSEVAAFSLVAGHMNPTVDSYLDIITNRSILLGNGDGRFQSAKPFAENVPSAIVQIGDLNGDDHPDVLTAGGGNLLTSWMGKGDGTLEVSQYLVCGSSAQVLIIEDVNGDAIHDLFVSYQAGSDRSQFYLGFGDGRFAGVTAHPTTPNLTRRLGAHSVAAAEVTGDGIIDLVVANGGRMQGSVANPSFSGTPAVVLPGRGDGGFGEATPLNGQAGRQVVSGDWNGDGHTDLAFIGQGAATPLLWIVSGDGQGGFEPQTTIVLPGGRNDGLTNVLTKANLDGEGSDDLLVANDAGGNVAVFIADETGTFHERAAIVAGEKPNGIVTSDFNGDGKMDVAIAFEGAFGERDGGILVALGNGDGTFTEPRAIRKNIIPISMVAADFNGDGLTDLAVSAEVDTFDWKVEILDGNGDATFAPPQRLEISADARGSLATADGDLDGVQDLSVRAGNSTGLVLRGLRNRQFLEVARIPTTGERITSVDLNADGFPDFVSASGSGFVAVGMNPLASSPLGPALNIVKQARNVILTWRKAYPEFNLAESLDLLSPWQRSDHRVALDGERFRVEIELQPAERSRYFRLESEAR